MSFSPSNPVTRESLINRVVRNFGADDDTELRGVALDHLDECIDELNTYLFEFTRTKQEGIPLVEAQGDYELQGSPYKESQAYIVETANNDRRAPMYYLPSIHFDRRFNESRASGQPYFYTLHNLEKDGKITIHPAPDASTAAGHTLTVQYYVRIPHVSSILDDARLSIPAEAQTALVFGAQKRMSMHLYGAAHPDVSAFDALENRALQRLIAIDRHHPDSNTRFRLIGADRRRNWWGVFP